MEPAYRRSVFYRAVRQLFDEGKPGGDVRVLWYEFSPENRLPFGALYVNPGKSVVLWPASPPGGSTATTETGQAPFDHITLDLRNERSHITGFDASGRRARRSAGSRLHRIPATDAALWCVCAFRRTVLDQQCGEFEWTAQMPKSDEQRREDEFLRYMQGILEHPTYIVVPSPRGDYVIGALYLVASQNRAWFARQTFPMWSFWNDEIDGWPDGDRFDVAFASVEIGSVHVGFATASPPGHLKNDVFVGCVE